MSVHEDRRSDHINRGPGWDDQGDRPGIAEFRLGVRAPVGCERMHANLQGFRRQDIMGNDADVRRADLKAVGMPADLSRQANPDPLGRTEAHSHLGVHPADRVELARDVSRELPRGLERCRTAAERDDRETRR